MNKMAIYLTKLKIPDKNGFYRIHSTIITEKGDDPDYQLAMKFQSSSRP